MVSLVSRYLVGRTLDGEPLFDDLRKGSGQVLIAGMSGSGKTTALRSMMLDALDRCGSLLQVVIFDPKRVGFLGWERRCHLLTRFTEQAVALDQLAAEMRRRYRVMQEAGVSSWTPTEEDPHILIVVDEMAAFTNNPEMTKAQLDAVNRRLVELSNQLRQAGMSAWYSVQEASKRVMPDSLRGNCSTRVVFRTPSEEGVSMASGGRGDECRADTLYRSGWFYALTSETNGFFLQGVAGRKSDGEVSAELGRLAEDKRPLPFIE